MNTRKLARVRKDELLELIELQDSIIKEYDEALLMASEIVSAQYEGLGIQQSKEELRDYFLDRVGKYGINRQTV